MANNNFPPMLPMLNNTPGSGPEFLYPNSTSPAGIWMTNGQNLAGLQPYLQKFPTREEHIADQVMIAEAAISNLRDAGVDLEVITTPEDHTFATIAGHKLIRLSDGVSIVVRQQS